MAIKKRVGLGRKLTHQELDNNFRELEQLIQNIQLTPGADGEPFLYEDFTTEQLADLSLTFDKLTEQQKEELKGLSAYQEWINLGNVGTPQDFINSLKGSDANVTKENIDLALGETPALASQVIKGVLNPDGSEIIKDEFGKITLPGQNTYIRTIYIPISELTTVDKTGVVNWINTTGLTITENEIIAIEVIENSTNHGEVQVTYLKLKNNLIHEGNEYNSWPISRVFYDPETDFFYAGFTSNLSHTNIGGKLVIYRIPSTTATESTTQWEYVSTVIDTAVYGGRIGVSSIQVMPNGDFLAITEVVGVNYKISRSTDKGATWVTERLNNGSKNVDRGDFSTEVSGLFCTAGGNVLAAGWGPLRIIRSTNPNGVNGTWGVQTAPNTNGIDGNPMEPSFIQLPNDRILCFMRRDVGVDVTNPGTIVYTYSDDDGITWSNLMYSNISNCFRNNVSFIHDKLNGIVKTFYTARTTDSSGMGTIYYSEATESEVAVGNLGTPRIIGSGSAGQDFGGSAVAYKPSDGTMVLVYYDQSNFGAGPEEITEIYSYVGEVVSEQLPTTNEI